VVTQYDYPGGPSVYAEGSWLLNQGFNMSYTLLCERATLDYDLARGADALIVSENGEAPRVVKCGDGDGYSMEINYIVDCVAKRRAPAVVSASDGVTALEICEAEERSIRSGAPVKL
jgi:predicted dehydrogenase